MLKTIIESLHTSVKAQIRQRGGEMSPFDLRGLLQTLAHTYPFLAYLFIFAVVYSESGLFFGFFLPGDSLLFTAGFLASPTSDILNLWILIPVLIIAAVLGNNTGYWFGRKAGPAIFNKGDSRFFKRKYLLSAHRFYNKHGGKTLILARFIGYIRTFAPIVAGVIELEYSYFLFFNVLGAVIWSFTIPFLGYFLGNTLSLT